MKTNKINKYTILSIFLLLVISFSSCKRNDPVIEDDQEEYDAVEVVFTQINDPSKTVKVIFNRNGFAEEVNYELLKNEKYNMDIFLFHGNENINQEVIETADEHKFFFFAPDNAVLDYQYLDDDLGLEGEISFGDYPERFDLKILLRHGLDKENPAAKAWNSNNYVQAGGVDDLFLKIPITVTN
jgi:hypothetical protein